MIAFFVAAFFFSLFFSLLLLLEPVGSSKLAVLSSLWGARLRNSKVGYFIAVLFILVFPFLLLCLAAGAVHPRYSHLENVSSFIMSPYFINSCVGALFSAVAVIWLYRLYHMRDGEAVPKAVYIEGLILIGLFGLGCSDVIAPYAHRLSNIEVTGAKLSFYQAAQGAKADDARTVVRMPKSDARIGYNDAFPPSRGLDDLTNMSEYMNRDNGYLSLIGAAPINPAFIFLVDSTFSAIGQCHNSIYRATGSLTFGRQQLEALLPAIRSYRMALDFSDITNSDQAYAHTIDGSQTHLGEVLATLAAQTIDMGIEVEVVPYEAKVKAGLARASEGTRILDLKTGCSRILSFPCLSAVKEPQLRGYPVGEREAYCNKICLTNIKQVNWPANCRSDIATLSPSNISFFHDYMQYAFPELAHRALATEGFNTGERPYWPLIYASVAAAVGQSDVASQQLLSWLTANDAKMSGPLIMGSQNKSSYPWYKIRVLSSLTYIEDEASRSSANTANRENFLVESYLNLVKSADIPFILEGRALFRKKPDSDSQTDIDYNPHDADMCKLENGDQKRELKVKAAYTQIAAMMNFVDKALDSADYIEQYSPDAEVYLAELNAMDFSCLRLIFDDKWQHVATIRHAELLRLNAKRILVEDNELATGKQPGDRATSLRQATWALESARRMLFKTRGEELDRRRRSSDFYEKIAGSEVIDTYNEILSLQSALTAKQEGN